MKPPGNSVLEGLSNDVEEKEAIESEGDERGEERRYREEDDHLGGLL